MRRHGNPEQPTASDGKPTAGNRKPFVTDGKPTAGNRKPFAVDGKSIARVCLRDDASGKRAAPDG